MSSSGLVTHPLSDSSTGLFAEHAQAAATTRCTWPHQHSSSQHVPLTFDCTCAQGSIVQLAAVSQDTSRTLSSLQLVASDL